MNVDTIHGQLREGKKGTSPLNKPTQVVVIVHHIKKRVKILVKK